MSSPEVTAQDDILSIAKQGLARRKTPGGTAFYEVGAGEALVLVHGVGMRLEAWMPQIAAFSTTHRVIAVDMPGHGQSEKLPRNSGLEKFVAWFGRFLEELQLEDTNIAGHSMGALVCGGAAAEFGNRISRVGYLNGVYCRDPEAKAAVMMRAAAIGVQGIDADGPLQRWFGDHPSAAQARGLTRHWLQLMDVEGYRTAYSAFAGGDTTYADRWPDIHFPALFLTGELDPNSTPKMARQLAAVAPNALLEVIQGHRHMINLTAPDVVNRLMQKWLAMPAGVR
jgi:pimeloyl-ACP methyl ester carboxylesterase